MSHESRIRRAEQTSERHDASPGAMSSTPPPRWPDIVTFVSSPEYLGRLPLYPLQLLLLKIVFLAEELLTGFDWEWLARWGTGFVPGGDTGAPRFEGREGLAPDVMARMDACRAGGRLWFRDFIAVIGRRGSKGYLGAICVAYVLWRYICDGDPHARAGIDKNTRLSVLVFAITEDQARDVAWRAIRDLITTAPCFAPYIAEDSKGRLTLYAHNQLGAGGQPLVKKADATFEIIARGATEQAARGRAVIIAVFDEMAWMVPGGANRSADEIYSAVMPAMHTFEDRVFTVQISSPWAQTGQFFANFCQAMAIDPTTNTAMYPDMLAVELPSWAPYKDWELTEAGTFEMAPGGPFLAPLHKALIADDESLQRERELDPDSFDIEYGAQWATSRDAFLDPSAVEAIFGPFKGHQPTKTLNAPLDREIYVHADPGLTDDHFAIVAAHLEHVDGDEIPHVVFDFTDVHKPEDFPNRRIDYQQMGGLPPESWRLWIWWLKPLIRPHFGAI